MGILKVRPGLLGNFSGGAGYMPFVVIYSYPVALIGSLVAATVIHRAVHKVAAGNPAAALGAPKVDLAEVQEAGARTVRILIPIVLFTAAALYLHGVSLIYQVTLLRLVAALAYAVAPLGAIFIACKVVVGRTLRVGPRRWNIALGVTAGICYLAVLLVILFFLTMAL